MLFAGITLGALAGYIVLAIGVIVIICCFAYAFIERDSDGVMAGLAILVIGGGIWLWAMWPPFAYEYHHWQDTEGTVETVSKRIVPDGNGGINEKYVIRFTDGRVRALNDTIGGTLREGDKAVLKCKKAYDFGVPRSSHGWDCKWAGVRL